jgi:hypothetical protein
MLLCVLLHAQATTERRNFVRIIMDWLPVDTVPEIRYLTQSTDERKAYFASLAINNGIFLQVRTCVCTFCTVRAPVPAVSGALLLRW